MVTVLLVSAVSAVGEETHPPCLGLESIQMMDAPSAVVAFDIGGDYAATLDNTGLTVWTFRADGYPIRRGSWVAPRGFREFESYVPYLKVDPRGWAYVGGWEAGFFITDMRNPDRPEIVFESILDEDPELTEAYNPMLHGDFLFLQTKAPNYHVFLDVVDPVNPRLIEDGLPRSSFRPFIGSVGRHFVKIPIRPYPGPIEIWDASDLGDPQLVATVEEIDGFTPGVMWAGETIALLAGRVGSSVRQQYPLGVLDLSDPDNPQYFEIYDFEEPTSNGYELASAAVYGRSVFFAGHVWEDQSNWPVLDWVDLTDPLTHSVLKRILIPTNDPIAALEIRDGRLYAALRDGGMRVFDIANNLEEIWQVPSIGRTAAIAFHRGRAVIPHGHLGLKIYEVDGSTRLTLRGHLPLEHPVVDLEISGDLAAVRGETADFGAVVYLVDLTDSDHPRLEAEILYEQPLSDLAIDGDLLVVTEGFTHHDRTNHEWEVFDVSRAAQPLLLAEADARQGGGFYSVDLRNGVVALSSAGSAELFDLADPTNPARFSWVIGRGDFRTSVALTDELMVRGNAFSTEAWDITDPVDPIEIPEVYGLRAVASKIQSFGNRIVGTSASRAWLFDLDDPSHPSAREVVNLRLSGTPTLEGDLLWVPSPPFLGVLSTECAAPKTQFDMNRSWKDIWLHSTTSGVVDTLIWSFGDGTTEEQDLHYWHRDSYRHHEAHHRYSSPGSYTIELTAIGPYGTSSTSQVVEVETPAELREVRRSGGRHSP